MQSMLSRFRTSGVLSVAPEGLAERLDTSAKLAVIAAQEESLVRSHEYTGTEHLLLSLLDTNNSGRQALSRLNVFGNDLRTQINKLIPEGTAQFNSVQANPMTRNLKMSIEHAIDEAVQIGRTQIGCEHLVLGLVAQPQSTAGQVLATNGLTVDMAETAVYRK